MSPAELYEVFYAANDNLNDLLEFIVSASFAVLVTTHFASARLNGFLYIAIGVIYTVMMSMLYLRMGVQIQKVLEVKDRLAEYGEHFADYAPYLSIISNLNGSLVYASTMGFLIYGYVKLRTTKHAVEIVP